MNRDYARALYAAATVLLASGFAELISLKWGVDYSRGVLQIIFAVVLLIIASFGIRRG